MSNKKQNYNMLKQLLAGYKIKVDEYKIKLGQYEFSMDKLFPIGSSNKNFKPYCRFPLFTAYFTARARMVVIYKQCWF